MDFMSYEITQAGFPAIQYGQHARLPARARAGARVGWRGHGHMRGFGEGRRLCHDPKPASLIDGKQVTF